TLIIGTVGDQLFGTVTPKLQPKTVVPALVRTDSFTVQNTGNVGGLFHFTATCGTFTSGLCKASRDTATLYVGASVAIGVKYTPGPGNNTTSAIRLISMGSSADTGYYSITARDSLTPSIIVSPTEGSTITSPAFTATVNVCDDGQIPNPTVTLNGVTLS